MPLDVVPYPEQEEVVGKGEPQDRRHDRGRSAGTRRTQSEVLVCVLAELSFELFLLRKKLGEPELANYLYCQPVFSLSIFMQLRISSFDVAQTPALCVQNRVSHQKNCRCQRRTVNVGRDDPSTVAASGFRSLKIEAGSHANCIQI